jgi:transcriptional regulator with XRE-family HTH domain
VDTFREIVSNGHNQHNLSVCYNASEKMARPLKSTKNIPPVCSAVVRLRTEHLKLTQQAFANLMGMAMVSIARYERGRVPDVGALSKFAVIGRQTNATELAEVFEKAISEALGISGALDLSTPSVQIFQLENHARQIHESLKSAKGKTAEDQRVIDDCRTRARLLFRALEELRKKTSV